MSTRDIVMALYCTGSVCFLIGTVLMWVKL